MMRKIREKNWVFHEKQVIKKLLPYLINLSLHTICQLLKRVKYALKQRRN